VLFAVVTVEVLVTYSRIPSRELYHVSGSGIEGGLSRALVFVNFPVALVALAVLGLIYTRLPGRAYRGVAILAAGLSATLLCWKRMGKSWRMGINPNEKTQLIVSGPYAYIRHPIYAIQSLMLLASMALLPSPLMLVSCLLMLTFLQWEARREEKYLVVHHGEAYVGYCRRTGGFLPRSFRAYRNT